MHINNNSRIFNNKIDKKNNPKNLHIHALHIHSISHCNINNATHISILHKKKKKLISFAVKFTTGVTSSIAACGTTTSSTSSKWLLSPTLEVSSEEKTSLINNLKTDSEGIIDIAGVSNTVGNGAGDGSGFVKLPIEDRNKYEKLRSNDQQTSDDSDSEYFQEDHVASGSIKKAIFKQIVNNNIPDTIHKIQQAAYHKVDKTQIKVPIVKKLRNNTKKPTTAAQEAVQQVNVVLEKHEQQQQQAAAIAAVVAANAGATRKSKTNNNNNNDSDADSIGSASDLRAEDDDFFDEHGLKNTNNMNNNNNNNKFRRPVPDMDGISESVKTCSSSAYHAECESVTTHEDDVSRVVVKVRMRKKDRISAAASASIDIIGVNNSRDIESELSPTANDEFLHKFGDKPLLLDDELDYSSADSDSRGKNSSSNEMPVKISTDTKATISTAEKRQEDLDIFAMAPFKMPVLPVKKRTRSTINKLPPTVTAPKLEIWTSTPIKGNDAMAENFANFTPQTTPSPQLDEFQETVFNPFTGKNSIPISSGNLISKQQQQQHHQTVQSASNFGTVTIITANDVINSKNTQHIPQRNSLQEYSSPQAIKFEVDFKNNAPLPAGIETYEDHDLFGCEPFPQVIRKCGTNNTPVTTTVIKTNYNNNNNSLTSNYNIVNNNNNYDNNIPKNNLQIKTSPATVSAVKALPSTIPLQSYQYHHHQQKQQPLQHAHSNNMNNSQIITINRSIIINKTPEPQQNQLFRMPATSAYVNVPLNSAVAGINVANVTNSIPTTTNSRHSIILNISSSSTTSTSNTSSSLITNPTTISNAAAAHVPGIVPVYLQNQAPHTLFPIADNGFVQIPQDQCSDFTPDDEEEPVVLYESKKYNSDRDIAQNNNINNNVIGNVKTKKEKTHLDVRTLPAKISQKVMAAGSYKKVSVGNLGSTSSLTSSSKQKHQRLNYKSHDDEDYENINADISVASVGTTTTTKQTKGNVNIAAKSSKYFQSNTIQNSAKTGFSNMSFEDFPSDQEIDRLSKTLPFEVVRNEKMILEAEKKFGSLKRRNNLFS